jgi:hypothetical protein
MKSSALGNNGAAGQRAENKPSEYQLLHILLVAIISLLVGAIVNK